MGDHYLPTRGRTPVTELRMRTVSKGVILVYIPGIYSEASYGDIGDSVVFEGPGSVPLSGHFWFEQLREYAVSVRRNEKIPGPAKPARP
jgi:hypothetical protein